MARHVCSTLILAGLLSLGTGFIELDAAIASPDSPIAQESPKVRNNPPVRLPARVINAVRQDVSRRTDLPVGKVKITEASRATFPNSCLGLPKPGEVCAEVLIEGFRIVAFPDISDTARVRPFIYRSDSTGRSLRLENEFSAETPLNLPKPIAAAVLRKVSQQTGQPTSAFNILRAERQTWPDGCLGLSQPGISCTQALVEGWQVTVERAGGDHQRFVYRTNKSGSLVKLDKAAIHTGDAAIKPIKIPANELPPPLMQGEIFRVISSGGITGRTTVTTLLADGRVIQSLAAPDGTMSSKTQLGRSRQQVRQFQRLLDRQQFAQFNRLSYPAPGGAADFLTITLTSRGATVRYTDLVQDRLPRDLQSVIQAFSQLTSKVQK